VSRAESEGRRHFASAAGGAATAPPDDELVVERRENGVRVFSLARPKANALGRVLLGQLRTAIEDAAHDKDARCVILRSICPGIFCAGADLKERATMDLAEVERFVSSLRSTFTMLSELPMPTIAVIDGAALGGGLELALCCDIRLAGSGEGSKVAVGLPETGLAIIPGAGGTQRLPRVVGLPIAKRLIFTGERLDAEAAAAIGLVEAVPGALPDPASSLDTPAFEAALAMAETIAR
jgi:methylglutaconyl-CoA hydratase